MPGTIAGGKLAAIQNKKRHGDDFYKRIALMAQRSWDKNGRKPRGFASAITCDCSQVREEHYTRQCAGKRGGRISRRGKLKQSVVLVNMDNE